MPLSEGIVPWPNVFACLRAVGFDGWVSLHSEYQGPHSWRELTTREVIEQTREDLTYLRQAIALAPGLQKAYQTRSQAYAKLKRTQEAEADSRKVAALNKSDNNSKWKTVKVTGDKSVASAAPSTAAGARNVRGI